MKAGLGPRDGYVSENYQVISLISAPWQSAAYSMLESRDFSLQFFIITKTSPLILRRVDDSRPFPLQCTRCLCVCSRAQLHNRRDSPCDYVSEKCQVIGPIKLRSPVPTFVTNRLHCLRMVLNKVFMWIPKTRLKKQNAFQKAMDL